MEIYRLSGTTPGVRRVVGYDHGREVGRDIRITELKMGMKNPERVNVFVDGEFLFSLSVAQVVDFHLKVGMVLTEDQLAKLREASEFGKLYQRALEWVLARPRSEGETREYLRRKSCGVSSRRGARRASSSGCFEITPEVVDEITERLLSRGYIDDRKFAEWYVENRFIKKGVSKKRLRMELMKKGVVRGIIEEVLGGRDDKEEIRKVIEKKRGKYTDEKLVAYLCRQGFSYDLVQELVREDRE